MKREVFVMSKPPKPIYSKGMLIYIIIATVFLFLLFSGGFGEDDPSAVPAVLFTFYFVPIGYSFYFFAKFYDYNLAQKDYPEYLRRETAKLERQIKMEEAEKAEIDAEYQAAVQSQNLTEPWAIRYSTSPCPYCGHYKVRYAKWEDKSMSVAFWGIASSKIGTNYKCEHCKRMW